MKIYARLAIVLNLALCLNLTADAGQFSAALAAIAKATSPGPRPGPTPDSGECDNCGGTGKLGDGTVTVTCPVCNGTGKVKSLAPTQPPAQADGRTVAASPNGPPAPWGVVSEGNLTPDQQPTPMQGVAAVLNVLKPQPNEVLVDFGCGFDARYLITACRDYGTLRAIGVEIDPGIGDSARAYVAKAGLSDRIEIITGDATRLDVKADIGVAYLFSDTLAQLKPKIQQLKRFASYAHEVPGLEMANRSTRADVVYLWSRPAPVKKEIPRLFVQPTRPVATWNGRTYTRPVCRNGNCSMCSSIRAQLFGRR